LTADTATEGVPTEPRPGVETVSDPFEENPAIFVGGAFLGGLALAFLLRRLGGSDD